ncbi:hypothetical protein TW65_04807 [Stemphylium lycopersici]|nr:hypothetical protein TW65_04807 [Stemphylium lycopersici]
MTAVVLLLLLLLLLLLVRTALSSAPHRSQPKAHDVLLRLSLPNFSHSQVLSRAATSLEPIQYPLLSLVILWVLMYSCLKTDIVEEERDQGPVLHGQYQVPAPKLAAFLIQAFLDQLQARTQRQQPPPTSLMGSSDYRSPGIHHTISSPADLSISSLRTRRSGMSDFLLVASCPVELDLHMYKADRWESQPLTPRSKDHNLRYSI